MFAVCFSHLPLQVEYGDGILAELLSTTGTLLPSLKNQGQGIGLHVLSPMPVRQEKVVASNE